MVVEGKNYWLRAPVKRHTIQSEFDIDDFETLTFVEIVYSYGDVSTTAENAVGKSNIKALTHAHHKGLF